MVTAKRGFLVIVAGAPGVGKSTVAGLLARKLKGLRVEADRFWPDWGRSTPKPWEEAGLQLIHTVMDAALQASVAVASDGLPAIMDFSITPWHMPEVHALCRAHGVRCHYVVLRATPAAIFERASRRGALSAAERNVVSMMIEQFDEVSPRDAHTVDTSDLTPAQIATAVVRAISGRRRETKALTS